MSYPPGAFAELCRIEDKQEKYEMNFDEAKKLRIEELRKAEIVRYTTQPMKSNACTARSLLHDNMNDDLLKEAVHQWLRGDTETAMAIFDDACEYALDQAADFLATCDAEVGDA